MLFRTCPSSTETRKRVRPLFTRAKKATASPRGSKARERPDTKGGNSEKEKFSYSLGKPGVRWLITWPSLAERRTMEALPFDRSAVIAATISPEGLEPLLQPLVEGLVELLGGGAERLLVDVLGGAPQDPLAERIEELPDPLLAVARLHELEGRVAHVVDEAAREGLELGPGELRHLVGHRGV